MNWEDAKAKCARLGMRLPTISELKAAYAAKATESWRIGGDDLYWSSTPKGDDRAYSLLIHNGDTGGSFRADNSHVRCLR